MKKNEAKCSILAGLKKSIGGGNLCYLITYSLVFAVTAIFVYSAFWLNDKSFVWIGDGVEQHVMAMAYIGRWGREVLHNLFVNHSLVVPVWDFSMGQGMDVITTLQYYGLGDPLVMLSVFVPEEHVEVLYNVLVVARVYLAGLFFVCFCLHMKKKGLGVIAGAIAYAFCGYSLYAGVRHPFFLTPMVFLPLLLLGSEKILKRENPAVFILSMGLTVISNYYFAYMECVAVIIYVVIRYFSIFGIQNVRELPRYVMRFVIAGLTGIALAATLFLPVVNVFLTNIRANANNVVPLLYSREFYERYFISFMGGHAIGGWTSLAFVPVSVMSIGLLVARKKQYTWLKAFTGVLLIMQMFPFFGHLMNGFSYVSNRWSWSFAFAVSYIIVEMWPDLMTLNLQERRLLAGGFGGYVFLCYLLSANKTNSVLTQWVLFGFGLLLLCTDILGKNEKSIRQWGTLGLCLASVILSADSIFVGDGYIEDFAESGQAYSMITDTASANAEDFIEMEPFGRYTLHNGYNNESILSETYGVSTYWSLIGNHVAQYRREMEIPDTHGYKWHSFDKRPFLDALNNVRYQVYRSGDESMNIEYGYGKCVDLPMFSLYENSNFLPIGYTYGDVLTKEEYEWLTAEQRQEAMLQNVLLEKETRHTYPADNYETTSWEVNYTIQTDLEKDDCVVNDNEILVKNKGGKINILFDPQADCEIYLNFKGLQVDPAGSYSMVNIGVNDGIGQSAILHRLSNNQFYTGAHDYLINMGYLEEERNTLTVTFQEPGVYSFENLRVVCQSMEDLFSYVMARSEESIETIEMGINSMSGCITVSNNKILCLAVPYSTGWRAYVDGEETPVLRANVWSMAVELEPGEHQIEFRYQTPWMRQGMYLTLAGVLIFVIIEYGFFKKKWYVK